MASHRNESLTIMTFATRKAGSDMRVPGTAVAGERALLVSVDRDILDLRSVHEIPIIRPGEYWRRNRNRLSCGFAGPFLLVQFSGSPSATVRSAAEDSRRMPRTIPLSPPHMSAYQGGSRTTDRLIVPAALERPSATVRWVAPIWVWTAGLGRKVRGGWLAPVEHGVRAL